MMHPQIEDQEIIERYVRNQLPPEEKLAFEEHFFSCNDCFDKVHSMELFVAGLRHARSSGLLADRLQGRVRAWRMSPLWIPAFAVTAVLVLVLGSVAGWQHFSAIPNLRSQLQQSISQLRNEQQARAALEQRSPRRTQAEANIPLIMLQATRDLQAPVTEAILSPDVAQLILWIDVEPGNGRSYRIEIYGTDDKPVEVVDHLKRNSYGALAVSLPAAHLQPGEFKIKLSAEEPSPRSLLAEYRLRISRP
jgi:putative zinc finger protein